MKATHTRAARIEGLVLVLILLVVAGFAGAASFTHVKDWTLANSPPGTGEWFGWANAVISELVPIAALLTIRQRRRTGAPIGYPLALLIAAACLSLSAQLAVAKPSPSGWLLSSVPALAFMVLAKLVLAPVNTNHSKAEQPDAASAAAVADTPAPAPSVSTAATTPDEIPVIDSKPAPVEPKPAPVEPKPAPVEPISVPTHLIPAARFALARHEQHTGRPITPDELAARLDITPAVAGQLLATINPPAATARINGNPILGGAN